MNCKTCQKEVYNFGPKSFDRTDSKLVPHKCNGNGNGNGSMTENKPKSLTYEETRSKEMKEMHLAKQESYKKLIESNHAIAKSNQDIASAIRQLAIALLENKK